jgi:hypothetical protein
VREHHRVLPALASEKNIQCVGSALTQRHHPSVCPRAGGGTAALRPGAAARRATATTEGEGEWLGHEAGAPVAALGGIPLAAAGSGTAVVTSVNNPMSWRAAGGSWDKPPSSAHPHGVWFRKWRRKGGMRNPVHAPARAALTAVGRAPVRVC